MFTNQSVFDLASNPTLYWRLNGTLVSSSQNLIQSFATSSSQEIRLKAKIPGCENEIIKNVTTVLPGPLSNFTFTNGCQASPVSFTNTTSGSVTSYSWIFGDGNTSSLSNASNTYANIGSYDVTLQANNAAGCQNSVTKSITIYSTPQPDFSIGLPPFSCAGSSSQFTDLTPAPTDSNITNWTWGFGDAANGSSLVKNPSYTYATANTYNVSLAVATNFGCTNSIQKVVTISPSPVAGFSNLPACVNQTTQFTDASSGSIKSRLWQIQSNTFSTANPQYTFPASGSFPVVLTVTGNNNCVSQASKNIVVPIVPSLDFSVQAPCADSPTVFTELTTSVDPSISKSWSFGSQGTGNGSPAQYAFSSTGTYVVRLNSTRQSGCIYSVSKNVTIIAPPIADFIPSIDAGAAPLPVSFTNNSSGANSYLWKFGDPGNSTSVLVSPTFVFSELGAYNVELSASNSVGCTNRLSKPISVVIPNVDAEMTDFFFVKEPKTGSLQPVVKLLNRSNITLTNPIILLDVAGGSGVSQQITGTIKPNQEISQMLDLKLVPKTNQYVCAEVVVVGDTDTFLNRRCLSLSGEEVLFTPFPNPAREQLNMDWISIDGSAVTFQVLTSAGAVSFQQTISSINPGLNRLVINTSTLLSGTYFIRFRDRTNDRTFSLVVLGN
ncbi:MAG: PKD domain-containing protein [Cyclobacteriaceae bacterium]|nr:PKD domain-containing protein [Cyclobacteriaceae bacterium]